MMVTLLERDLEEWCRVSSIEKDLAKFTPVPFEEWVSRQRMCLESALSRAESHYLEDLKRVTRANAWITEALMAIEAHVAVKAE